MPDDKREHASQSNSKKIQLLLQFRVEDEEETIEKEIAIDITPEVGEPMYDSNPFRAINNLTAAVLKLFHATPSSEEASAPNSLSHESKNVDYFRGFTPRELEVLQHLLTGSTNHEIAQMMGISSNTVKFHIKNVFQKLNVKSRVELASKFGH